MIDTQVMLNDDQRGKLFQWLNKNAPKSFPNLPTNAPSYGYASRYILPMLNDVPKEDLDKLLSAEQKVIWKEFVGRYAGIRRLNAARAVPAARAIPAAPARRIAPARKAAPARKK